MNCGRLEWATILLLSTYADFLFLQDFCLKISKEKVTVNEYFTPILVPSPAIRGRMPANEVQQAGRGQ